MAASDDGAHERLTCTACGATNRADARFCRSCGGASLETKSPGPPSANLAVAWSGITLALTFGALLLGTSVAGMIAIRWFGVPEVRAELAITAADALLILGFASTHRDLLAPLLNPAALRASAIGEMAVTGLGLGAFAFVYFHALRSLGVPAVSLVLPFVKEGWPLWTVFAFISLAPGVFEEIAFRGVILGRLTRVLSTRESWFIQAALFAALHLSPAIFPSHFVIGLLLGRLRLRTGSLYPSMVVHAAYNAVILCSEV